MTTVFVGGGNMARALIGGMIDKGHAGADILVVDPSDEARRVCRTQFGIAVTGALDRTLAPGDTCVLAVKPQLMRPVCEALSARAGGALFVSVAAGIRIESLSGWLGGHSRIARAMPNTPALIGLGVAGLVATSSVSADDRKRVEALLRAVGEAIWFDTEGDLDAVTAVSGSGPAYVFRWIEAMHSAAVQLGLPPDKATTLILNTVRGAAELALRSSDPVARLREQVTSPNGTTAAGLDAMNAGNIEKVIGDGVRAAHARSVELGKTS